jgi:hypothetical protein
MATLPCRWRSAPTKAANFRAWLAQYEGPKIAAIEVINEPNNTFASQVGAGWKQVLVTLADDRDLRRSSCGKP